MRAASVPKTNQHSDFLPDFCTTRAVLGVLLITQLVAFLLLLAGRVSDSLLWQRLLLLSLYLHWIGLCSAGVLCRARHRLAVLPPRTAVMASYTLLLLVTIAIAEVAWQIARWQGLGAFLPDHEHGVFLMRNLSVCAIVSALALRYFWVRTQWRGQLRAEGEARYQALQARIRPHFLFNSLNSIAALIGLNPRKAETAVEDLAQLFRAGLSVSERRIPLIDEIEVTRAYLRTESLRLGDRLRVTWTIDDGLDAVSVPPLCLQPLLENAVTHGVEALPEGGEITVSIHKSAAHLLIEVRNPVPDQPQPSRGAQTALENIRQRLQLIYGEQAELRTEPWPGNFRVQLKLPLADTAVHA